MLPERNPREVPQRLAGDVVVRGAEAARDDDEVGLVGGEAQGLADIRRLVIHEHRADALQAQRPQGPGEEERVSVRIGARQQLVAGDDDHVANGLRSAGLLPDIGSGGR